MVLIKEQIGRQLRRMRHERGLGLKDVGALSNVSWSHLSQIERGLSEPSSEILDALCDVFDVVPVVILQRRTRWLNRPGETISEANECLICDL